jgi:molecular chaperone DnaK (HSP70)
MSVVGFDFGGQSCVVAVAKKRGIETVQNSVGNRQTASLVSYQGKQRFIGDAATPLMRSNAKNSVRYVKRILGLRNDDPSVQEEQSYISAPLVKGEDGLIRVKVNYEDKQQELRPEVVTSALLSELKGTAERSLGNRVSDCVISVPHHWPDGRRRALLDAARAANLNVLRLFNENTAVALKYGILRPLPENETRVVAFVDFGQTQFSASLVSFTTGELKVLATTADTTLGCRNLDRILAEHFVEEIKTKFKMDVSTNPKAMIKLMKECERVKKTLSANTTVNWNVEYIMNDKDVRGEIKRETFEAAIKAKLKSRFEAVLAKLFEQPGAKDVVKEKLHSIEIIGGGVRIPAVQQIISGFFGGGDLSKTCDGDESVAHGCAWQCAMLSPSFQVKRFEVKDICPFAIEVAWGPGAKPIKRFQMGVENEEKCTLVFQPGNLIPSKKMVSFKNRQGPFNVVGRYADPVPQYADRYIGEFQPKIPNAKVEPCTKREARIVLYTRPTTRAPHGCFVGVHCASSWSIWL